MKALLVEGDPETRALVEDVLRMQGHTLEAFGTAEAAWAALQREAYNLVILDWVPAGAMDGLEICRRIRALPGGAHREILVMTAHDQPGGLAAVLDAGASDYLLKPFSREVLQARLTIGERRARAAEERMRLDAALAESKAHYYTLVEQLPDVYYTTALQPPHATTHVSPRIETLLGITPAAWLDSPDPWQEHLHPDDRARVLAARHEARTTGHPLLLEYRLRTHSGQLVWVRDAARVVRDQGGRPVSFEGVLADITTQKMEAPLRAHAQAQEGLATLTRLANSTLDLDTLLPRLCPAITMAGNVAHASVFLLTGSQTLRLAATTLMDLVSPLALGPLAGHLFAAGQAVRDIRALSFNQVSAAPAHPESLPDAGAAADEEDTSVLAAPLLIGDEVVGAVALSSVLQGRFVAGDLTGAMEIAQIVGSALRNARIYQREHDVAEQLRQMERWRGAFLRVMAHEVRTPLGQISGFSDLLNDEATRLTERGQRHLANVRTAAARLEVLVQRSFDLLRLSADEAPREQVPVEVGQLVEMALAGMRPRAAAKGLTVLPLSPVAPVEVVGDRQQLHQALLILLDNAEKFTPAGGSIAVTVQRDVRLVEITVCDSGPGVPAEVRTAIFGGGQAEDPLTRQHGGMGLSLQIARQIVALHGGELRLDVPEQGACFVMALPVGGAAEPTDVSQTALRRQLVTKPSSLAVVYWGVERLAPWEAQSALTTLAGHERAVMVGRFAYVEAPPQGQPERRAGAEPGAAVDGVPRLADLLTDPAAREALEQRVQAALEGGGLTMAGADLAARAGLPWRTLEAVCYASEEKGLLQVVQPAVSDGHTSPGDFAVLQVTLSAVTKAGQPPREPTREGG